MNPGIISTIKEKFKKRSRTVADKMAEEQPKKSLREKMFGVRRIEPQGDKEFYKKLMGVTIPSRVERIKETIKKAPGQAKRIVGETQKGIGYLGVPGRYYIQAFTGRYVSKEKETKRERKARLKAERTGAKIRPYESLQFPRGRRKAFRAQQIPSRGQIKANPFDNAFKGFDMGTGLTSQRIPFQRRKDDPYDVEGFFR